MASHSHHIRQLYQHNLITIFSRPEVGSTRSKRTIHPFEIRATPQFADEADEIMITWGWKTCKPATTLDIPCMLLYTCSMAATPSTMLPLGTAAPPFALPEVVSGETISLETFADKKALLVMFLCRHCKYVQHVKKALTTLGQDYQGTALGIVAISANDAGAYADDAPESLKAMAAAEGFTFPYCYDETQAVAKAYTAACTPDFFLFDRQRKLVYRGQLDDSRPGNQIPVTGKDLRAAIEAVLADQPINPAQKPSLGCNIKWKEGNEPAYFLSR